MCRDAESFTPYLLRTVAVECLFRKKAPYRRVTPTIETYQNENWLVSSAGLAIRRTYKLADDNAITKLARICIHLSTKSVRPLSTH
jgi:hypothetical protein